jgi:THO complex subunit 1 transcription elongation factor
MEEIKEQIVERQQNQGQIVGGVVTDSKLYRNFWNLQKYLANPLSIFTSKQLDFEVLEE